MTKSDSKRKTRSDKFPLTLHPTGQFCKKIKGRLYYFGTDRQQALQCYLEQASHLHGGHPKLRTSTSGNITVTTLCNLYLQHQESRVEAGELSARHFADQINSLRMFAQFLGKHCMVSQISTLDLQNYKRKLQKNHGSAHRTNLHISNMKAMFNWARNNDVLQDIPNLHAVAKVKLTQIERQTFTREQVTKLLEMAKPQMKAMILLGLNCGFGCTDCAELRWQDLNLKEGRVKLARKKTGVPRNLSLWPETAEALEKIPQVGPLVFYTAKQNPWVRTIKKKDKHGVEKYTIDNCVSKAFAKLMKKAGIKAEKGVGFYTLRRTAATLAAQSGDPFAVQRLLGHADLRMASTYVQDVSEQTDRVVNNVRKLIIQDDSSP